jgi:hypothetical protein
MKFMTGTVVQGKVQVPDSVADGVRVMILAPESEEPLRLTPDEENDLFEAMEEIRRGEFIDGQDLVDEIRAQLRS